MSDTYSGITAGFTKNLSDLPRAEKIEAARAMKLAGVMPKFGAQRLGITRKTFWEWTKDAPGPSDTTSRNDETPG